MKVNEKDFRETVEKVVASMISSFTSTSNAFDHALTHLENKDTRERIVKAAILVSKDIYSGVKRAKNTGRDGISIYDDKFTTIGKTIQ